MSVGQRRRSDLVLALSFLQLRLGLPCAVLMREMQAACGRNAICNPHRPHHPACQGAWTDIKVCHPCPLYNIPHITCPSFCDVTRLWFLLCEGRCKASLPLTLLSGHPGRSMYLRGQLEQMMREQLSQTGHCSSGGCCACCTWPMCKLYNEVCVTAAKNLRYAMYAMLGYAALRLL